MKMLITGGSGTIGKAFIKEFPNHEYTNISRNESFLTDLMREFPNVKHRIGNIEDRAFLIRVFKDIKPDVMVIGSDWKGKRVVGEEYAGKVEFFDRIKGYSTTKLLKKLNENL